MRLKVWFNDGVAGFQQLTPDQRIAAVGYAMIAGNVLDGTIASAKIANGAVGNSQLASGAVTAAKITTGAVGSSQLATGAVTAANVANGAITSIQLAAGAVGFSNLAKPPQAGTVDGAGLIFDFAGEAPFTVTFPQAFAAVPVVALSLAPGVTSFPTVATSQVMSSSASQFAGKIAVSP